MNASEPSLQAALDAAMTQIKTTAASVGLRVSENLAAAAQSSGRIRERDLLISTQLDLRRNMAAFQSTFHDALRERVRQEIMPRTTRRSLGSADWQSLSLVDDSEVEERMNYDRVGQMIAHECEWQLRDLAAYMGSIMGTGRADEDHNPLRADVLGAALYQAIEAVSDNADSRKLLARDMGQVMAQAMPACYGEILRNLQERGVQPVTLSVRGVEGPGNQLGSYSGYASLPGRDLRHSTGSGTLGMPSGADNSIDLLYQQRRALAAEGAAARASGTAPHGALAPAPAGREATTPADAQLMALLRRLTAVAGHADARETGAHTDSRSRYGSQGGALADTASSHGSAFDTGHTDPGGSHYGEPLTGLMAVNLIRAHREELMQASTGKLDHMVIDVVGSLFDQILSDSRVPPQMARQIARLQLPVLRVALNDQSFFSTRRHPVRRFVNRIASLACAFDDFEGGPGKQFLNRVAQLVQEITEGDFDQTDLYAAKLAELEAFIAEQTQGPVQQSGAARTLESKESELRVQQRYMLQLQGALAPLALPVYLRDFVAQVWSQALVLATRRDGADSELAQRFRRAGRDLVMSVQPKGSPAFRKKFLMQLPPLMKDLHEGMRLIGWPEPAQKAFFGQLLPAHAESLKGQSLSELDHNLMVKQLEAIFAEPVPGLEAAGFGATPAVEVAVIERRFTPEEAEQVGLVAESAVDWSSRVVAAAELTPEAIEPGAAAEHSDVAVPTVAGGAEPQDVAATAGAGESGAGDVGAPTHGPQLFEHVQLGCAYQMHLKDAWQKVRLAHVSSGRSFFVFTRGVRHQETISMTSRMLARMCETGRMRAIEGAQLMERATQRARRQLAEMEGPAGH